jgi:hypothetical protein
LDYLWRTEILNNWSRYWCPIDKKINSSKEVRFDHPNLKKEILDIIAFQGGLMKTKADVK